MSVFISAYDVVANHLANIYKKLETIETEQDIILSKLCQNEDHTSCDGRLNMPVSLPCASTKDVELLEDWLCDEDNLKDLVSGSTYT